MNSNIISCILIGFCVGMMSTWVKYNPLPQNSTSYTPPTSVQSPSSTSPSSTDSSTEDVEDEIPIDTSDAAETANDMSLDFEGMAEDMTLDYEVTKADFIEIYTMICDDPSEIANSDSLLLALLRNGLYAMHGYNFDNADIRATFEHYTWYEPTVSPANFSTSVFSEIEMQALTYIMAEEAKR